METILELITKNWGIFGVILTALILTVFQISPIKINPWSAIKRYFGFHNQVLSELNGIKKDMNGIKDDILNIQEENEKNCAINKRTRIQRTANEIAGGMNHTKEMYEQILEDIDDYTDYCEKHPEFRNRKTVFSADLIEQNYKIKLRTDEFLK